MTSHMQPVRCLSALRMSQSGWCFTFTYKHLKKKIRQTDRQMWWSSSCWAPVMNLLSLTFSSPFQRCREHCGVIKFWLHSVSLSQSLLQLCFCRCWRHEFFLLLCRTLDLLGQTGTGRALASPCWSFWWCSPSSDSLLCCCQKASFSTNSSSYRNRKHWFFFFCFCVSWVQKEWLG